MILLAEDACRLFVDKIETVWRTLGTCTFSLDLQDDELKRGCAMC